MNRDISRKKKFIKYDNLILYYDTEVIIYFYSINGQWRLKKQKRRRI